MTKESICLQCPLFQCDEKDARCAVTNPLRRIGMRYRRRRRKLSPKAYQRHYAATRDRSEYFREYYEANRERKLAAAIQRYHANKGKDDAHVAGNTAVGG